MGKPLVIFDGDDTLWLVEHLYDEARTMASAVVAEVGLDPAEWESLERLIDVQNVSHFGVSRDRFPTSCVQAYQEVARNQGDTASSETSSRIWQAASTVFDREAPSIDGVTDIIADLRLDHHVALLTKGDEQVQRKRLADAGLTSAFTHVSIVPTKGSDEFLSVVRYLDVEPRSSWSVGNSLASDINPALRVQLSAIWIEAHVWEHERRELTPHEGTVIVAERLSDVPTILRRQTDYGY